MWKCYGRIKSYREKKKRRERCKVTREMGMCMKTGMRREEERGGVKIGKRNPRWCIGWRQGGEVGEVGTTEAKLTWLKRGVPGKVEDEAEWRQETRTIARPG